LLGRFWIMVPVLAIAGSLAAKNTVSASAGTLPTHTPLFIAVLGSVVVMVGVLTFVPAPALGPVAEHLMLFKKEPHNENDYFIYAGIAYRRVTDSCRRRSNPRHARHVWPA